MAGEQAGKLSWGGAGWLAAAELTSVQVHLGKGSNLRQQTLCQIPCAVTLVAPGISAPCPGSSDSRSWEETDAEVHEILPLNRAGVGGQLCSLSTP